MRVASLGVARPAYYDRNATNTWNAYAASGVAPHAGTTRWTLTIASGKKCILEVGNITIWRETVAAPVGQVLGLLRLVSGATTGDVGIVAVSSNTLQTQTAIIVPYGTTLYSGDVFSAVTADASTGGTNYYNLIAKGTIFDA